MIFHLLASTGRLQTCLRTLAVIVGLCLVFHGVAHSSPPTRQMDTARLKHALMKQGLGAEFMVKEVDGTLVTGSLTAMRLDAFDITPDGTTQVVSIPYAGVQALNRKPLEGGDIAKKVETSAAVTAVSSAISLLFLFVLRWIYF